MSGAWPLAIMVAVYVVLDVTEKKLRGRIEREQDE